MLLVARTWRQRILTRCLPHATHRLASRSKATLGASTPKAAAGGKPPRAASAGTGRRQPGASAAGRSKSVSGGGGGGSDNPKAAIERLLRWRPPELLALDLASEVQGLGSTPSDAGDTPGSGGNDAQRQPVVAVVPASQAMAAPKRGTRRGRGRRASAGGVGAALPGRSPYRRRGYNVAEARRAAALRMRGRAKSAPRRRRTQAQRSGGGRPPVATAAHRGAGRFAFGNRSGSETSVFSPTAHAFTDADVDGAAAGGTPVNVDVDVDVGATAAAASWQGGAAGGKRGSIVSEGVSEGASEPFSEQASGLDNSCGSPVLANDSSMLIGEGSNGRPTHAVERKGSLSAPVPLRVDTELGSRPIVDAQPGAPPGPPPGSQPLLSAATSGYSDDFSGAGSPANAVPKRLAGAVVTEQQCAAVPHATDAYEGQSESSSAADTPMPRAAGDDDDGDTYGDDEFEDTKSGFDTPGAYSMDGFVATPGAATGASAAAGAGAGGFSATGPGPELAANVTAPEASTATDPTDAYDDDSFEEV